MPARDYLGRAVLVLPHRQFHRRVVNVADRVGPVHSVGQGMGPDNCVGLEGKGNPARNRLPVGGQRIGYGYADQAGIVRRHVVLPTAPNYGITVAHQEAVARPQPLVGAVEVGQRGGVAPVHHVKQDAVVAPLRRVGLQDAEVGDAMHQAVSVPGGQLQVGYYAIGRVIRVNGKMGQPIYLPVGSGAAKNRSIGKGPGGANLQSGNCHG